MTSIILQITCLLILSAYLIFAEASYPATKDQWFNQYSNLKKSGRPLKNYVDKQQQIFDIKQLAPNRYSYLDTFGGSSIDDLDKQQQKLINKREIKPSEDTNSDKFNKSLTDDSNKSVITMRKKHFKKMTPNLKHGRSKKKNSKSGSDFETLNTKQENEVNNTLFVTYGKEFGNNVLKNVFYFSNEIHAVIRKKLLDFVKKLLDMIVKSPAAHDRDASLRIMKLTNFINAISDEDKQRYAFYNPDKLLTLHF